MSGPEAGFGAGEDIAGSVGARTGRSPRTPGHRSARVRLAALGVAAAAVLGSFAVTGLQDSMVYYRTASEMAAQPDGRVRLGGLVARDTLVREGTDISFDLTDGAAVVPVVYEGTTTAVFREGQGAVVEGEMTDGTFVADTLLVKHDNQYVSADGETYEVDEVEGG